jgi:hypothetical protein
MTYLAIAHMSDGTTEEYPVSHLSPQKPSHLKYVIENHLREKGIQFTSVEIIEKQVWDGQ